MEGESSVGARGRAGCRAPPGRARHVVGWGARAVPAFGSAGGVRPRVPGRNRGRGECSNRRVRSNSVPLAPDDHRGRCRVRVSYQAGRFKSGPAAGRRPGTIPNATAFYVVIRGIPSQDDRPDRSCARARNRIPWTAFHGEGARGRAGGCPRCNPNWARRPPAAPATPPPAPSAERETDPMRNLLALIGALVVGVGGLGWYLGWYKVQVGKAPDGNVRIE